jgi:hypothetical protein
MEEMFETYMLSVDRFPEIAFMMIDTFEKYVRLCCHITASVKNQKDGVLRIENGEMLSLVFATGGAVESTTMIVLNCELDCFLMRNMDAPLISTIEIVRKRRKPETSTVPLIAFEYKNLNI